MAQILISNMSYYYSDYYYPIFNNTNLILDTDWKTGLIGRNGCGKTTFLQLLYGAIKPNTGFIKSPCKIDYFPYEEKSNYKNVMDVIKENIGGLRTIELAMEDIIMSNSESRLEEYSDYLERYIQLNGFEVEVSIQKEFDLMKLDKSLLKRDYSTLSGGEKTAVQLIALFLKNNNFILLDEPTNHLDSEKKEMILNYLKKKKGFILVSHDRYFLDEVVNHIMAINKADITIESGNYSTWKQNKDWKEQFELQTKIKLENEIKQLGRRVEQTNSWAEIGYKQKYDFICNARTNGFKSYYRQRKRSQENIEKNIEEKKSLLLNFEERKKLVIEEAESDNEIILIVNNLDFTYPDSNKKIIDKMSFKINKGERLWIKGKNGSGKTTLLKLLGLDFKSDSIEYAEGLEIVKVDQEPAWKIGMVEDLFWNQKKADDERFEKFMAFCECFDVPKDFYHRPIETLSFGERKKVDIARALSQKTNLIILDEPLNYMDIYFREQLEEALLACNTTVIFVEHDERFGIKLATQVLYMKE